MSGRLVGEVVEWLRTPAAADLTAAERVVLLVIAERANETTREMWRHKVDDVSLSERIREALGGVDKTNLSKVFKKLASRGLEVRIPVSTAANGRVVYSCRGRSTRFHVPPLPASVQMPESVASRQTKDPVDNPASDAPDGPGEPPEWDAQEQTKEPKGTRSGKPKSPNGCPGGVPYPSKESPSTTNPSPGGSPTYVVEEEDTPPANGTPSGESSHRHMGWEPDYIEAHEYLFTLANEGQEFMDAAAQRLGPRADVADRVIQAAQLAWKAATS
jgi:hypothetical protein